MARNAWLALTGPGESTALIGATHLGEDAGVVADYVDRVFGDYLTYLGWQQDRLAGQSVLEIGPGDNFGVALRFIAAGAEHVTCVERFVVHRDEDQQADIYRAILDGLDGEARARAEDAIDIQAASFNFDPQRIRLIEGTGIDESPDLGDGSFGLVVSRAVLEYVQDVPRAMGNMDRALATGGAVAHKIDLRDHGLYTAAGHPPLTFLRRGPLAYRLMAGYTGIPNRWRESDYVREFSSLGYEVESLVTHLHGSPEEISPHRADLTSREEALVAQLVNAARPAVWSGFSGRANRDLGVAGVFIVARKPGGSP